MSRDVIESIELVQEVEDSGQFENTTNVLRACMEAKQKLNNVLIRDAVKELLPYINQPSELAERLGIKKNSVYNALRTDHKPVLRSELHRSLKRLRGVLKECRRKVRMIPLEDINELIHTRDNINKILEHYDVLMKKRENKD